MDEIKKKFREFDRDGDGYISHQEAHQVLHGELGFSEDKTKHLIKVYDRNGDGRLNYEEFVWFYWRVQEKKDELLKIFMKFDKDNDKVVTFSEACSVLKGLDFSDSDIWRLMELHDVNKDGVLQYEEFVHFWSALGGKPLNL